MGIRDELNYAQFVVHKFGFNPDVDTATVPEQVTSTGTVYLPSSAVSGSSINIVSTSANDTAAGTGARTITLQGLTTGYEPFTETITLNGLTNVNPQTDILRVNCAFVETAGSGETNAGNITVADGTGTFITIPANEGQSLYATYTVPAGHTAYLRRVSVSVPKTGNKTVTTYELMFRPFGGAWRVQHLSSATSDDASLVVFDPPLTYTEKTDLRMSVTAVGANNTPVASQFTMIVVRS